ncbi:MAG TPA: Hsp20/alpha crystallin family protein [Steroidobacteraceae bacterium]
MNRLRQVYDGVQEGVARTWETLTSGWRELSQRAAHALTRFHPSSKHGEERQVRRSPGWGLLAADVGDDDDWVEVTLEAPGIEPDDFQIEVIDNRLRVCGEKRVERRAHRAGYAVMERAYGRFERWIPLWADVDPDHAEAKYRHGVLTIRLRKRRAGPVHRIRVERA